MVPLRVRKARGALAALALAAPSFVMAEMTVLAKPEVESLITGKRVEYDRTDSSTTTWAFEGDGRVYYQTSKALRVAPVRGSYTIGDDGSVCFKWEPDRYLTIPEGCYAFARDEADGKVRVVSGRNRSNVVGVVR